MATADRAQGTKRKGFFARWFEAMAESRMRQAEHEAHQHLHDEPDGRADTPRPHKSH